MIGEKGPLREKLVLGIDPGLVRTGWGLVRKVSANQVKYVKSGVISTLSMETKDIPLRILHISRELDSVLREFRPDEVAIEETYVNLNPRTSLKLGMARGAIFVTVANLSLQVFEYSPRLVKKLIVGSGGAEKQQVSYMVKILLGNKALEFRTEDESDAVGIGLAHALCHKGLF